jgi:hypothetical protein
MNRPDLDQILAELEKARVLASMKGNASAMVSATMAKAKLLGLDKGEVIAPQETKFNISFISPTGEVTATAKAEFEEVTKEVLA